MQTIEDSQKTKHDQMENDYELMKQEFERIRAVIGELADVFDEEFP